MITKDCYNYKKIIYNDPIFTNTIDATYIIHLENNGRLENIMKSLSNYHITNTVYIVFNKGYKKCKKKDFIINPPYDLVDAFINIFNHANSMNYNNILVLEDDFIFSKEIKNRKHINNINKFLNKHNNESFQYYLGCVPLLLIPYDYYNYKQVSSGTHAVIYSKKMRDIILKKEQKKIVDWDFFNNYNLFKYRYTYYKPLCYQLFPETENSKYWFANNNLLKIPLLIVSNFIKYIYKLLKMDIMEEPGFSYFYIFGKLMFYIILLVLIKLLYYIFFIIKS